MRRLLVPLSAILACSDPAPPPPTTPAAPQLGEWTTKATAARAQVTDPKAPEAERACATARTAVQMGKDRSEAGIAEVGAQVEKACLPVDAWALLLRSIPEADGPNRLAYCAKLVPLTKRLEEAQVDVAAIREAQATACKKAPVRFEVTGELAKVAKLDPRKAATQAICTDAHTEALRVMLRDRTAGEEQERTLAVVCALPDLWTNLQDAADRDKPAEARDNQCISAKVWIAALAKNKQLKGKPLAQARAAFKKACKKWQKVDPIAELPKLAKLDPKSKDARGLCARAGVYVTASEAALSTKDLAGTRDKACAVVDGWVAALDAPCAVAEDRLEKRRALLDPADLNAMSAERKDRCK